MQPSSSTNQSSVIPTPNPIEPTKKSGLVFGCVIAIIALIVLFCASLTAGLVWLGSGPEGGVRLGSEMEEYAIDYQRENGLLNQDEVILAYYDYTISLSGSESAYLTDQRIFYQKDGNVQEIPLEDVVAVTYEYDDLIGYTIFVDGNENSTLRIEIAIWNGGEIFLDELKGVVED
jgi:hypothetical protein